MYKKNLFFPLLIFLCGLFLQVNAQVDPSKIDINNIDFNTVDLSKIDPSQIPDESILKAKGLSDEQINKIMQYKNTGKISPESESAIRPTGYEKTEKKTATEIKDSLAVTKKYPSGRIYGQDLFRNNNIKFFEKASEIVAPDNYVLSTDDEINIAVWGYSEYNEVFKINEKGYIAPKLVGRIYLKGMTFGDAKTLLTKKFGTILDLQNSQIDVILSYSRVINVNIIGEVFNPGSYKIPAINTAFNALVAVGGPSDIGTVRKIYIKRSGKIVDSLDVYRFLMDERYNPEIYLENNDYIYVPIAKRTVKLSGEIKRPHIYELKENENLTSAINYAGGITASGYTPNIQILRYTDNQKKIIDLNYDSLSANKKDFALMDEDEVIINKIPDEMLNTVTAEGRVKLAGKYELKKGDRISDLLEKTEGVLYDAYLPTAYVYRLNDDLTRTIIPINLKNAMFNKNSGDNIVLQKLDILNVLSKNDFKDIFSISVFGDVRKPGNVEYNENILLKDVLFLSGGLKPEAASNRLEISRIISYDTISGRITPVRAIVNTVQINPDLSISEEAKNLRILPYDQIFVRTNPDFKPIQNVVLSGEVQYPGTYILLNEDEQIASLIERAGGLTEYAFAQGVTVWRTYDNLGFVYLNLRKALNKPKSKYNLLLRDNDTINISRTRDLVYIFGEFGNVKHNRINVPYFTGKRALFYVKNFAGGFSKNADKDEVNVISADGIYKKTKDFGIFRIYPKVKIPGSSISIPVKEEKIKKEQEKKPVDWNKFLETTTIKITAVLTIWLLLRNVTSP